VIAWDHHGKDSGAGRKGCEYTARFAPEALIMWLKTAIIIVFLALLLSLGSGLVFLFKDRGEGKRTMYALGIRVTLAVTLLVLISYGVLTGKLQSQAPWSKQLDPLLEQQQNQQQDQ
jgi:hypothetical protein